MSKHGVQASCGARSCGRDHVLSLDAAPLAECEWIAHYKRFWEDRLEALDKFVTKQRKNLTEEEIVMNDIKVPKLVGTVGNRRPCQELFDAWLDPESLGVWMRPATRRSTMNRSARRRQFRDRHAHAGRPVPHSGTYKEMRLVFTWNSPYALNNDSLVTVEFRLDPAQPRSY